MSIATVVCRAQLGLHAPLVQVEVSLDSGLPNFSIVGLAATVVKESKDRVRAAIVNSNFEFPAGRITVNLSPADIPKRGGRFDLPIALGDPARVGAGEDGPGVAHRPRAPRVLWRARVEWGVEVGTGNAAGRGACGPHGARGHRAGCQC